MSEAFQSHVFRAPGGAWLAYFATKQQAELNPSESSSSACLSLFFLCGSRVMLVLFFPNTAAFLGCDLLKTDTALRVESVHGSCLHCCGSPRHITLDLTNASLWPLLPSRKPAPTEKPVPRLLHALPFRRNTLTCLRPFP